LPLPDEVKLYIDQLVEAKPKTTPGMIMGCLMRNPSFANRPFLTDKCRRVATMRKVKSYRPNAQAPPHGLPATVKPKQYETIHPGTSMSLKHAKAFLESFFLPHQKRSKGGGHNGQLVYSCHRPDCTLLCRLVPVPNSDPPLYKVEVKSCCSEHTNHNALEDEQAQQSVLVPVVGPSGKSKALPLSDEVKLYIDQLVEVNPKTTPDMIMVHLVAHPSFANRPFLMETCRADTTRKVKCYRYNASRAKYKRSKQS
jgi:hypothetical protein